MRLGLWNVRVLLQPKVYPHGAVLNIEDTENTKLILALDNVLAQNQDQAKAIAATQIPKEYHHIMERIEVSCRPF